MSERGAGKDAVLLLAANVGSEGRADHVRQALLPLVGAGLGLVPQSLGNADRPHDHGEFRHGSVLHSGEAFGLPLGDPLGVVHGNEEAARHGRVAAVVLDQFDGLTCANVLTAMGDLASVAERHLVAERALVASGGVDHRGAVLTGTVVSGHETSMYTRRDGRQYVAWCKGSHHEPRPGTRQCLSCEFLGTLTKYGWLRNHYPRVTPLMPGASDE